MRFAAVPSEKGGQDIFGAYDIVPNWPKPLSTLPGHEKWTWGAGQSVFAESPNRVFVLQRGELPNITRPATIKLPQLGPNIEFPNFRLPFRDATVASPPGALERDGKPGDDSDAGQAGVDFRWEHCIVVVDAAGNIIEDWTQWDKMLRRPHAVYISPAPTAWTCSPSANICNPAATTCPYCATYRRKNSPNSAASPKRWVSATSPAAPWCVRLITPICKRRVRRCLDSFFAM